MDSVNKCYSAVNFFLIQGRKKMKKLQNAEGTKTQAYINGH